MSDGPAPRGLRLGSVLGVPVVVAPSWLLFAGLLLVSYGPLLARQYGDARGYLATTAFALLLLASVLLHEIGHCVVARAFGLPVRSITVTFLAGLTEITEPPQTPFREYAVAVVGPLVSAVLGVTALLGRGLVEPGGVSYPLVEVLGVSNLLLAAFNLLPGLPLDGGRVLRAGLWRLTGDPDRSTRLAAQAGRGVGLVVVPLLLLVVLPALDVTERSITTAVFTVLVSSFIYAGATATLRRAAFLQRLPGTTVAALARPALAVRGDVPLAEAVRRARAGGAGGMVVVGADGRVEAVVSEAALSAVPEQRRPWVPVSSVARPFLSGLLLDAGLGGTALLAAMRANPATEYVVDDGPAGYRVLHTSDVAVTTGS